MNTVIVEPNKYTGAYLVQSIALNFLQPNLKLKTVSKDTDKIINNSASSQILYTSSQEEQFKELGVVLSKTNNLSIIHTCLIDRIIDFNRRTLYITYDDSDIEVLKQKRKVVDKYDEYDVDKFLEEMTEEHYNFCKGSSYPSWEEFKQGNIPSELLRHPNEVDWANDPLNQWKYNSYDANWLNQDTITIKEIKFKNILEGYDILDEIIDFFQIKIVARDQVKEDQKPLIDDYRNKFFEVDY